MPPLPQSKYADMRYEILLANFKKNMHPMRKQRKIYRILLVKLDRMKKRYVKEKLFRSNKHMKGSKEKLKKHDMLIYQHLLMICQN